MSVIGWAFLIVGIFGVSRGIIFLFKKSQPLVKDGLESWYITFTGKWTTRGQAKNILGILYILIGTFFIYSSLKL